MLSPNYPSQSMWFIHLITREIWAHTHIIRGHIAPKPGRYRLQAFFSCSTYSFWKIWTQYYSLCMSSFSRNLIVHRYKVNNVTDWLFMISVDWRSDIPWPWSHYWTQDKPFDILCEGMNFRALRENLCSLYFPITALIPYNIQGRRLSTLFTLLLPTDSIWDKSHKCLTLISADIENPWHSLSCIPGCVCGGGRSEIFVNVLKTFYFQSPGTLASCQQLI